MPHRGREPIARAAARARVRVSGHEVNMEKRPALGKGLRALIPDAPEPRATTLDVDIDRLSPNDFQPRQHMDDQRLESLARSVASNGVIQPIVVRPVGDRFQIIAGERRWRAALKAGLARVPVVVREVAVGQERSLLEIALIENVQREDLNPIEEARAYRQLTDQFQLTQEAIAAAVGKDRASIANYLRLLNLPDDVQHEVAAGRLSMGHARALLALSGEVEQRRAARTVIARGLSVRETEAFVKRATASRGGGDHQVRPRTSTHVPQKSACGSRSAPACESYGEARRDGSRSTSRPRTNSSGSTNS